MLGFGRIEEVAVKCQLLRQRHFQVIQVIQAIQVILP